MESIPAFFTSDSFSSKNEFTIAFMAGLKISLRDFLIWLSNQAIQPADKTTCWCIQKRHFHGWLQEWIQSQSWCFLVACTRVLAPQDCFSLFINRDVCKWFLHVQRNISPIRTYLDGFKFCTCIQYWHLYVSIKGWYTEFIQTVITNALLYCPSSKSLSPSVSSNTGLFQTICPNTIHQEHCWSNPL